MKKALRITALILCLAVLLCSCSAKPVFTPKTTAAPVTEAPTTPFVLSTKTLGRLYVLSSDAPGKSVSAVVELGKTLFSACGIELVVACGNDNGIRPGDIVIEEARGLKNEEYEAVISEKNIRIKYTPCTDSGFFDEKQSCRAVLYGLQAVLKGIIAEGDDFLSPRRFSACPETKERTLMLDCARKCWSPEWIKKLISEMSWMGFNALELHLTEEQGIRFNIWESRNGDKIRDVNGNDFSFICGGTKVSWNTEYAEDTEKYICREDIEEIVEFAESHRIEIIPAVDLPGHSTNLLERCTARENSGGLSFNRRGRNFTTAIKKLAADGSKGQAVDVSSEIACELSFALVDAYAEFFRVLGCEKFNICADEVTVDDPAWAEYAKQNGGKTQNDAFIIYINSLCALLKEKGYRVRAFNDSLFGGSSVILDPELEICCWSKGGTNASKLVEGGRTVYNCNENFCYYALRTDKNGVDARDENNTTWSFGHSTAERIFSGCKDEDCFGKSGWNPSVFPGCTEENAGGAYFLIWGDFAALDSEDNIFNRTDSYSLVDRMWASCAKMLDWDMNGEMSYEQFSSDISAFRISPEIENQTKE